MDKMFEFCTTKCLQNMSMLSFIKYVVIVFVLTFSFQAESANPHLFTLKIFYRGQVMLRRGSLCYVSGGIEYINNLNKKNLCLLDLDTIGEMVGYPAELPLEYYYRTQMAGAVGNFFRIENDDDVLEMTHDLDDARQIVVYIVYPNLGGKYGFSLGRGI